MSDHWQTLTIMGRSWKDSFLLISLIKVQLLTMLPIANSLVKSHYNLSSMIALEKKLPSPRIVEYVCTNLTLCIYHQGYIYIYIYIYTPHYSEIFLDVFYYRIFLCFSLKPYQQVAQMFFVVPKLVMISYLLCNYISVTVCRPLFVTQRNCWGNEN